MNHPQHSLEIRRIWASASCTPGPIDTSETLEREDVLRKEPLNHAILAPRFVRKFTTWNPLYHAGGTYLQNCRMEIPRNLKSRKGMWTNSLTPRGVQSWKTNFQTEVCSCSVCPALAMFWIKEVAVAKLVDDLRTLRSIERHVFLASAMKRIITNQYFRSRINVGEQHAQKHDRFLRGRGSLA